MNFFSRLAHTFVSSVVLTASAFAANTPSVSARPQTRVVAKIDNAQLTVVTNSRPGVLALAVDKGRLAAGTQLSHMMLVLKSSDEQEYALHSLLDEQQDKGSANFHKWMTPDTFAASFGVASTDLAKISGWLQDAGFTVDTVAKGARVIQFSGTASQVETAFHTEMHQYDLNGELHLSNASDISLPTALTSVVVGVSRLNDFRPKANAVNPHKLAVGTDGKLYPVVAGTNEPDYTSASSGSHYIGPGDLATIYNGKPLLATGIDGTGVKIGIIGQSSINISDYQSYRSLFNLPKNDLVVVNVGPPPATIADDIESDLDVELAGSLATNAGIYFYTAGGSLLDSGVDTSSLAAVDANLVDIISLSYGGCEVSNGSGPTAYYNTMWEQAAAQGQTVFVSSGDSSATGCASSSAARATGSAAVYSVNALGSGAYNVAVGGSEFFESTDPTEAAKLGATKYWGPAAGKPYSSALSYIPETVWSEGVFDIVQPATGLAGAGGGVSIFTARPPWQVGPGITAADPAGPTYTTSGAIPAGQAHRLVPDLSFIAAGNHDGTIFCSEGVCKLDSAGNVVGIGVVGGTSVATPAMASVQALINQKNGGRQGNANYYYYKLAAAQTTANCASTLPPAAACNFTDIVTGNNYSPLTANGKYNSTTMTNQGVLGTDYIGFAAGVGFDVASGLGSPNITNLANNWSAVTFNATKTTLTLSPTTTTHGTAMSAGIAVASVSGSGTPTGDVSITAVGQSAGTGDGNVYHLSGGSVTASLTTLPGGTYSVVAHYAGDSVFGASDSAPVTVTISPEDSVTFVTSYNVTTAGSVNAASTFAYGTSIYLDTEVQGVSATGVNSNNVLNTGAPTGTVAYAINSGSLTLPSYSSALDVYASTYLEIAQSFANFLIYANYPALSPAPYTVKASYAGDKSFNTSNASVSFTVVKATVAPVVRAGSAEIASGATATFNVSIAASGGGVLPTGTVTLTDSTTSTTLGTGTLVNGAAVVMTTGITTSGAHSIVATYGGDGNYNTAPSAAATVTVGGTASTMKLASSLSTAPVLTAIALTATPTTGATGTVYFYDGAAVLGSATISTSTGTAALSTAILTAGTHSITATYAGSATYQSSTSAPLTIVVTQNTPTLSLTAQQATSTGGIVGMNAVLTLSPVNAAVANPAPSALVQFLDGTTVLGSAPLTYTLNYRTYAATFNTTTLTPGPHALTAKFVGDTNYAAATSGVQNVSIGLTTTTLTSSVSTIGTYVPLTFTAKVVPQVSNTTATTGSVTFMDGTTSVGTAPVSNGTATLAYTGFTSAGPHIITAVYSGDANFYTSTSAAAATVTATTNATTTTVSSSAASAGTKVPVTFTANVVSQTTSTATIGGTVTFLDGPTNLGSAPVVKGVATLVYSGFQSAGAHTVTAVYVGDANYATSTSATGVNVTATINPTTTTLTSSTSSVGTGISFTLTAKVATSAATSASITGNVTFLDGTTVLGTAPVVSGTATFTASLSSVATHTLTAQYGGDTNFATSTTATGVSIVAVTPGFALTASTTSLTIKDGATGSFTLTGTPFGNYAGSAALGCTGLPAMSFCSFSSPSLTFDGSNSAAQTTVTIQTYGTSAAGLLWLPAAVLGGMLAFRRRKMTRLATQLICGLMLLCGSMAVTGCGTGGQSVTPKGTSTVVITAYGVGSNAGSPSTSSSTVSVMVTVQ